MIADELLDRSPWFVYGSVFADGESWRVSTYENDSRPDLRTFSIRAAFLWNAVIPVRGIRQLRALAQRLGASERGFYAGQYESGEINRAVTLATNASILEASFYVSSGRRPLLRFDNPAAGRCAGSATSD
jgi:hypothetical protein